jgi:hypothetical protein
MADLRGNPWNFLPADQAATASISSIVRNNQGSALITTSGAHGLTGNPFISVQGVTPQGWTGGYEVLAIPSTTTLLVPIQMPQTLLANAGAGGAIFVPAYMHEIEVTQMLWDNPTAGGTILLTDLKGVTLWTTTPVAGGTFTYMKCFPVFGLVINTLPTGLLQISV